MNANAVLCEYGDILMSCLFFITFDTSLILWIW